MLESKGYRHYPTQHVFTDEGMLEIWTPSGLYQKSVHDGEGKFLYAINAEIFTTREHLPFYARRANWNPSSYVMFELRGEGDTPAHTVVNVNVQQDLAYLDVESVEALYARIMASGVIREDVLNQE